MNRVRINDARLQEIGTSRPDNAGTQRGEYGVQDAQRDVGVLAEVGQENQYRSKTNRYLGFGALGAAALVGVIGAGAYFGEDGIQNNISNLNDRVSEIEDRIDPKTLDIRSHLVEGGEQGCINLGGQVAESNNDRQYGWSDCRFTSKQYGDSPYAFAERVIKDEYSNDMLSLADERDDLTRDPYSKAGLEALLNGGYAGIIAEEAPQRQTAPSHSHTPKTQTITHAPTSSPEPKEEDYCPHGNFIQYTGPNEITTISPHPLQGRGQIEGFIDSPMLYNAHTVNGTEMTWNQLNSITDDPRECDKLHIRYTGDMTSTFEGEGGDGPTEGRGETSEPGEPNGGQGSQAGGHDGQSNK